MKLIKKIFLVGLLFSSLGFSGCSKQQKTLGGAIIGAGSGALVGGLSGGGVGAGIGAIVGAGGGALIGHSLGDD